MMMEAINRDGSEVKPKELLGTHTGALFIGCFSAGIILDCGVKLMFKHPDDVPEELMPSLRSYFVPVTVKVYIDRLERIVYDAERSGSEFLARPEMLRTEGNLKLMDAFEIPVTDEQLPAPPTKFWKTTITVTILTEGDEPPNYDSLADVVNDMIDGDASGQWTTNENKELEPQAMADALVEQGSDPEFLGIQVDDDNKVVGIGYE